MCSGSFILHFILISISVLSHIKDSSFSVMLRLNWSRAYSC